MLGGTPVEESSPITILRAPERDGHLSLLFFAEGREPVVTNVIFSGLLLSAREPFGGKVDVGVPSSQPSLAPHTCRCCTCTRRSGPNISPITTTSTARRSICAKGPAAAAYVPSRQLPVRRELRLLRRHARPGKHDGAVSTWRGGEPKQASLGHDAQSRVGASARSAGPAPAARAAPCAAQARGPRSPRPSQRRLA